MANAHGGEAFACRAQLTPDPQLEPTRCGSQGLAAPGQGGHRRQGGAARAFQDLSGRRGVGAGGDGVRQGPPGGCRDAGREGGVRLSWRARVCGVCWCCGARSAAAQARPWGLVGRSALGADSAAMLASGSRRRTRTAHCVRSARTTAASQLTKRAARADPDAALLAALKGPAAGPARRLRGRRSRSP